MKHETGGEIVLRGWVGPSRYISERRQRQLLADAKVRAIYSERESEGGWEALVKSLRPEVGDQVAVADLRIFGSLQAAIDAAEEVAARGATLYVLEREVDIDLPTLKEVRFAQVKWRGTAASKGSKRMSAQGKMGAAVRKRMTEESRLEFHAAWEKWHDTARYPLRGAALAEMPGWEPVTAWRNLGGGRDPAKLRWSKKRREAWAARAKAEKR